MDIMEIVGVGLLVLGIRWWHSGVGLLFIPLGVLLMIISGE